MFINNHEALAEDEVDECVEMDIEDDLESMVKCAVDGLWGLIGGEGGLLGNEKPSEKRIREALEHVKEYKVKNNDKAVSHVKEGKSPRYYGLLPNIELEKILNGVFANAVGGSWRSGAECWEKLKKEGRVTREPHVTIVHQKALPQEQDVWNLARPVVASTTPTIFNIKFGKVLWNERVMVLTVDHIEQVSGSDSTPEGRNFLDGLPDATRNRLHVTVGTAKGNILPVEGKKLVECWRMGGKEGRSGISEADIGDGVVVTGLLKGLFS
jgi:tRNA ligase